ncbi:MAG: shikimate kinase [Nitrospirae bacterium]|nr:shikimate kinase [Nitrospirota bacterium]
MKSNVTLIGMPGAGKSTTGIILAKYLSRGFLDTDVLIQINRKKSLQEIIDESGYLALRKIEEEEILGINVENHVIATGGSAVYSPRAMSHLRDISNIVFLSVDFETILKRIHNFDTRGIAKTEDQTFRDLYNERQILYEKYAEWTIDCSHITQEEAADMISKKLPGGRAESKAR